MTRSRKPGPRPRGLQHALLATAGVAVLSALTLTYYYVTFSQLIDARLHGERERTLPRVYARPLVLWSGQGLSRHDLI